MAAYRQTTTLDCKEGTVAESNFYKGRDNQDVTKIVIHTLYGNIDNAHSRYNHPKSGVSMHYVVDEKGTVTQFVKEADTAYATSNWQVDIASINIDHVDHKDLAGKRPDELYKGSARLIKDICLFYDLPIDSNTIVPHHSVSGDTHCCNGLKIDRLIREAKSMVAKDLIKKVDEQQVTLHRADSLLKVAKYLKYPQELIDAPGFGDLLIDKMKQVQTAYLLRMQITEHQEGKPTTPITTVSNPLLYQKPASEPRKLPSIRGIRVPDIPQMDIRASYRALMMVSKTLFGIPVKMTGTLFYGQDDL